MLSRRGAVTGIDLGHHAVKLVRLDNGGAGPLRLTHWGVEEIPSSGENTVQERSEALEHLLDRLDLRPRQLGRVAAAVGGADVYLRQVALPRLPDEDLRKALPYEAKKHLPIENMDRPCVDYQVLGSVEPSGAGDEENPTQEVLLVAASRQRRNDVLEVLHRSGIDPDILDAQPLPTVNAVLGAHPVNPDDGWVVILDLGLVSSTLVAVLPEGTFYARPLDFTGQALTAHIEKQMNFDRPTAEIYKRELGEQENGGEPAVRKPVEDLVRGLSETFRFLRVRRRECPVTRIYLCGGGAVLHGLRDRLASDLGVEVSFPDPFQGLKTESGRRPGPVETPWLVGALGLAEWWD